MSWLAPAAIVLVALAVRVAVLAADDGYQPRNDSFEYDLHARSIAAGEGYPRSGFLLQGGPNAIRGPGYPAVLGGTYAVTGDSITAGRLAGAALGALTVLLVYLIARRIWGRRAALVAAAMTAVFPPLVALATELWSESLFIPLALAAVLCVLHLRRTRSLWWAAAAGTACGVAILTRNVGVAVLVPVVIGTWTVRPRISARALAAPAVVIACAAIAIAPWTIRNAVEFGRFVPVTTSAGLTAGGIYNRVSLDAEGPAGAWRSPQVVPEYTALFRTRGIDEATVDATLRRRTREFALEHPLYVAETSWWNLVRMLEVAGGSVVDADGDAVYERGVGSAVRWWDRVALAIAAILAVLGVAAIVRSRRRSPGAGPPRIPAGPLFMWLIPVLVVLASAPLGGLPRYRVPADPFLLMLAAVGATWAWGAVVARRRPA